MIGNLSTGPISPYAYQWPILSRMKSQDYQWSGMARPGSAGRVSLTRLVTIFHNAPMSERLARDAKLLAFCCLAQDAKLLVSNALAQDAKPLVSDALAFNAKPLAFDALAQDTKPLVSNALVLDAKSLAPNALAQDAKFLASCAALKV